MAHSWGQGTGLSEAQEYQYDTCLMATKLELNQEDSWAHVLLFSWYNSSLKIKVFYSLSPWKPFGLTLSSDWRGHTEWEVRWLFKDVGLLTPSAFSITLSSGWTTEAGFAQNCGIGDVCLFPHKVMPPHWGPLYRHSPRPLHGATHWSWPRSCSFHLGHTPLYIPSFQHRAYTFAE